jgi:hypothetical protein
MLDFPTIESDPVAAPAALKPSTAVAAAPSPAIDLTKVDLTDVALAQFGDWRADVSKVRETLDGVVHDLSTPGKLADAKSLRHRLINTPLAEARKVSQGLKSKLTAVSKAIGGELTTIEAAYESAAELISPQIEAREAQVVEEKRIAAEKEQARQQLHRDNLAKLAGYAEHARGLPSARIQLGIDMVSAIVIDRAAWEDFADQAEEQKAVTLERMQALLATAKADEDRARIAAEQKVEADRLAAERAEIERQKAELAAAQAEAEERARVARQNAEREEREAQECAAAEALRQQETETQARQQQDEAEARALAKDALKIADAIELGETPSASPASVSALTTEQNSEAQEPQHVLKAEPATADATDRGTPVMASPSVGSMGAGQPADAGPVAGADAAAITEFPTLTVGQINERLYPVSITADGVKLLGFKAQQRKGAGVHFLVSDFPEICRAAADHLTTLASQA